MTSNELEAKAWYTALESAARTVPPRRIGECRGCLDLDQYINDDGYCVSCQSRKGS